MLIEEIEKIALALEQGSLQDVSSECLLRTSCGKHYYHIFHLVGSWLRLRFESFLNASGGATHKTIRVCCELLGEHFNDKDFKKLSLKLKMLHDIRVHADYRIGDDFNTNNMITLKSEKTRTIDLMGKLDQKYFTETVKQA